MLKNQNIHKTCNKAIIDSRLRPSCATHY